MLRSDTRGLNVHPGPPGPRPNTGLRGIGGRTPRVTSRCEWGPRAGGRVGRNKQIDERTPRDPWIICKRDAGEGEGDNQAESHEGREEADRPMKT